MRLDEMDIPLERDVFLRSLVRELSGVLEDVLGIKKLWNCPNHQADGRV